MTRLLRGAERLGRPSTAVVRGVEGGKPRTDRYKGALERETLDAARRERAGEVVERRPDGKPFDHVNKVREAQSGLHRHIRRIKRRLSHPGLPEAERAKLVSELGEASRLLDHAEDFVPRP